MLYRYLQDNKNRKVAFGELMKQVSTLSHEEQEKELAELRSHPNIGTWWDSKERKAYWRYYDMSAIEKAKRKAQLATF